MRMLTGSIETLVSQWGYHIDPNREPSAILSRLGDTFILIKTLFSQWGYQQTPIGNLLLYYPDWEIHLSWLKPQYSPNEDTNRPQSGTFCYTIPIGRYIYPDWNPILQMRIPTDPNREPSAILSQLGDTFILIETLFSQWGYQQTPIGNLLLYYPDWEIHLSWLKPYSPNEDTNRPQSGTFCYTIPIGRYIYPDWNPILPMRIPTDPNREPSAILSRLGDTFILIKTLFSKWGYQQTPIGNLLLYYPNWEIHLSWLKPYSPNEDTNRPQSGTFCYTIPIGRYIYPD